MLCQDLFSAGAPEVVETELPLVEEAVATMMPAVPAASGPGAEEASCCGSWAAGIRSMPLRVLQNDGRSFEDFEYKFQKTTPRDYCACIERPSSGTSPAVGCSNPGRGPDSGSGIETDSRDCGCANATSIWTSTAIWICIGSYQ